MVTTDDADLAAWHPPTRLHGMSQDAWRRYQPGGRWRYDVAEPGLKANMSDVQAAIGRAQLRRSPAWQDAPGRDRRALRRGAGRRARPRGSRTVLTRRRAGTPGTSTPSGCCRSRPHARRRWPSGWPSAGVGTSVHFIPVHQLHADFRALAGAPRPACPAPTGVRPASCSRSPCTRG